MRNLFLRNLYMYIAIYVNNKKSHDQKDEDDVCACYN